MRHIGSREVCSTWEGREHRCRVSHEALPREDGSCVTEGSRARTAAEGIKGGNNS